MKLIESLLGSTAEAPATGEVGTTLLDVIYARFEERDGISLLDLGEARGSNVEFYSQFSRKIFVQGIFSALRERGEFSTQPAITELIQLPPTSKCDLVMVWDLLPFIGQPLCDELFSYLRNHLAEGAMVYLLLPKHTTVYETPAAISILNTYRLLWENSSTSKAQLPRCTIHTLRKALLGFKLVRSSLLKNGYEELLFEFKPE